MGTISLRRNLTGNAKLMLHIRSKHIKTATKKNAIISRYQNVKPLRSPCTPKRKRRNVKPHIIKSVKIIMKRSVIQNIEKKLLKRKNKSVIPNTDKKLSKRRNVSVKLNTERNVSQAMVMAKRVKISQRRNAST